MKTSSVTTEPPFYPKGAIAFFISLLLFFAVLWMGFYVMTLQRSGAIGG